ncbi:hypothetical protein [Fluviibacter phosphoraccumulans]|uniref:hypothetical protein n=1 Tax=Fluviibacter phosphoraccumulans TaxID=1751046 RepID=UPI0013894C67|nr:hypothetical protein [Fluviibacter phosphoraccumulans]
MKALIAIATLVTNSTNSFAQVPGTTSGGDLIGSGLASIFTFGILAAIVYFGVNAYKQRQEFAKMNYDWYVAHVPLVNGKVVCRYCGSNKTLVKNGRNNSNIRTHYCGQCGQGLYYSLEDWRV